MSMSFQLSKRTISYALGWLCLAIAAGGWGVISVGGDSTVTAFGFILAFNCFWAAIESLRGRRFARIALDRAILVLVMMMGYWILRTIPLSDSDPGMPTG
ncbi:MAG TPA: hypothetical protein VGY55_04045 [Pirellulales bacterium]|jgi:hypothetical protein|nr:hypothetical protein [Pirellulales bacterium]